MGQGILLFAASERFRPLAPKQAASLLNPDEDDSYKID